MSDRHLKQSYKETLVRAGVGVQKAENASQNLTLEDLRVISEIWSTWASALSEQEKSWFQNI